MTRLKDHDRWTAACHHEAAHCVVAMRLGLPIDDITLTWQRRLFARIPLGLVRIPDHITDPEPLALVAAAGALGEASWVSHNHNTTLGAAYTVAEQLNVDDATALDRYLVDGQLDHQSVLDETLRLIDDSWELVEYLAGQIDTERYLTGRQLRVLAGAAGRNR